MNEIKKGTRVQRINIDTISAKIHDKGTATGEKRQYRDSPLVYVIAWDNGCEAGSRAENLKIIDDTCVEQDAFVTESDKKSIRDMLRDSEILRNIYANTFSNTHHNKENNMSAKIITVHQVVIDAHYYRTKELTVDQTAKLIRQQTDNIKALADLPVKTAKIEAQIIELQADLDAFIEHMDTLP